MLTVVGGAAPDCTGLTRRNFLQAGTLGLGGLPAPEKCQDHIQRCPADDVLPVRMRLCKPRRQNKLAHPKGSMRAI
jgi:hypothetical protein